MEGEAVSQTVPIISILVIRRSTDNGKTWSDIETIIDYPGSGKDGASTIDASLLQDRETGTIWLLIDHFPGGVGFWNAEQGTGFDAEGHRLLYDKEGHTYTLRENGHVYDENQEKTDYHVADNGDVTLHGTKQGNIYLKAGAGSDQNLYEDRTAFLQILKSEDDGKTWSKPADLNSQVKASWMKFIGTGPGNGIQLENGRLVFPIYYTNGNGMQSSAVIYSDDHGETWKRGKSPNDGRVWQGEKLNSKTLNTQNAQLTESQVVQLNNGDLRLYMRNTSGKQRVAVATSQDGGETWDEVDFDEELIDPYCQSSVITYPDQGDGKDRLLFSNPADESNRVNGTLRLSENGGDTWNHSLVVQPGEYAYSSLTVLPDGKIGLLYEDNAGNIQFTKVSLSKIRKG